MNLKIHTQIASVHILEEVRTEVRVVECRILQAVVPEPMSSQTGAFKIPPWHFYRQILGSTFIVAGRDSCLHHHHFLIVRLEVEQYFASRFYLVLQLDGIPHHLEGEWFRELCLEVDVLSVFPPHVSFEST